MHIVPNLSKYHVFDTPDDPQAVVLLNEHKLVKQALIDGNLYGRFIDGDRKGSVTKLIPDPSMPTGLIREVKVESSRYNSGYRIEGGYLWCVCTWKGRKNKVKVTLPHRDIELLIGDSIETIWSKFDAKAAKQEVLKNPNQKDIDGNVLTIGDKVLYINARYGSGMTLERGTVKEFKVVVNSESTSISTIIESDGGETSSLTYPQRMVYKNS